LAAPDDRYEPLPGLFALPGFLYRRLGPRGRVAAKLGGALLLVVAVVAAIVLVPRIADTKRERADQERRDAAAALAERRQRLIAEQRPHRGRASARAPRAAVVAQLQEQVLADARARAATGKLAGPAASRVECHELRRGVDAKARVAYECIAVTSDLPSVEDSPAGVVGHPFRAVVDFSTGRFTWCKVSGRPGEGSLTARGPVTLPRACSP
jgi:hypothetical protein